jgi:hypothetical protein
MTMQMSPFAHPEVNYEGFFEELMEAPPPHRMPLAPACSTNLKDFRKAVDDLVEAFGTCMNYPKYRYETRKAWQRKYPPPPRVTGKKRPAETELTRPEEIPQSVCPPPFGSLQSPTGLGVPSM